MESQDVGHLLHRAVRLFRIRLSQELRVHRLTPQQASVLMALAQAPEQPLTHKVIGERTDSDPATTSGLLTRLERDGWLVSSPNPEDKRSRLFALSAKAHERIPLVFAAAEHSSSSATAVLSPEETATLVALLSRILNQADAPQQGTR